MRRRPARATGTSAPRAARTFEGYWTRTGDKYVRDGEGRYTFCGRTDDMFKVSGIWVSPFEVESALITHPAVLEAAVVPEADPDGLLKPKAFVVLRADAKTDGLDEALKDYVKQKIGVVEISALDRGGGLPAEDRDGEDPALQAAGWRFELRSSWSHKAHGRARPGASTPRRAFKKDVDAGTSPGMTEMRVANDTCPLRFPLHRRQPTSNTA